MNSIGKKATSITAGRLHPIPPTAATNPSDAASE